MKRTCQSEKSSPVMTSAKSSVNSISSFIVYRLQRLIEMNAHQR